MSQFNVDFILPVHEYLSIHEDKSKTILQYIPFPHLKQFQHFKMVASHFKITLQSNANCLGTKGKGTESLQKALF